MGKNMTVPVSGVQTRGMIGTGPLSGSSPLGEIVAAYLKSPQYQSLGRKSALTYEASIFRLGSLWHKPFDQITEADIWPIIDDLSDRPATANNVIRVCKVMFNWARARMDAFYWDNPFKNIKALRIGEHLAWDRTEIDMVKELFDKPSNFNIALMFYLGLETGQRLKDIMNLRWKDYNPTRRIITVHQSKTGKTVVIPVTSELRRILDQGPMVPGAVETNIVQGSYDRMRQEFAKFLIAHDLEGLTFHGLRKTCAKRLAEAGCSEREIMAITGHTTTQMVSHYVKQASQEKMAVNAIAKMEEANG